MNTEKSRQLAEAYHRITAAADEIHAVSCELHDVGERDLTKTLDEIDGTLYRVRKALAHRSAAAEAVKR